MTSWKKILSVGVPAAISNALSPIATALLTAILATFGADVVAAYGVASRVEGLVLIPAFALGASMTPFVGQNWGGHQEGRVREGLSMARKFVLLWGLGAWAVVAVFGRSIGSVFSDHEATIDAVQLYLWIVPASFGAAGVVSVVSAVFNAVDRAVRATLLSAIRSLVLAVPLAALGAWLIGVPGVFGALAITSIVTAGIATLWAKSALRPESELEPVKDASELTGARGSVPNLVDQLLDTLTTQGQVVAAARPINTIGFYVEGYEVGHVHRSGKVDFHVPPGLHDVLILDGLCEEHRYHEGEQSWVTHTLQDGDDVKEAAWILGVLAGLRSFGAGKLDREGLDEIAHRPDPKAGLHPALDACLEHIAPPA